MKRLLTASTLLMMAVPIWAQGAIYVCVDEATGTRTYQDFPGKGKTCKKLEGLPEINSMPATKPTPKSATKAETPANFPKVDEKTQRGRDDDRKKILDEELKTEQARLAELQKEYNSGQPDRRGDERNYQKYLDRTEKLKQDIERSQKNIEALQKELNRN